MSSDNRTPGEIASDFQTISRLVTINTPGFVKVADRDPRRVYIQFWFDQSTQYSVLPEPGQGVTSTFFTVAPGPVEYLLRDFPSAVVGEWYVFVGGGVGQLYVNESIYLR